MDWTETYVTNFRDVRLDKPIHAKIIINNIYAGVLFILLLCGAVVVWGLATQWTFIK
jgi:hypothetical protein